MLKYDEQHNEPAVEESIPVESVRVTAAEFAAAIQALEQRRSAEAAHRAGTVEIGPTIQELNIDASPDEVYREVYAQRALKAKQERASAEGRKRAASSIGAAKSHFLGAIRGFANVFAAMGVMAGLGQP